MKVLDLNEFLRKARKEGILASILVDFTSSTYRMGTGLLTVSSPDSNHGGVRFLDGEGREYHWGLDLDALSAEIVDLRKVSKKVLRGGPFTLIKLGRKCSGKGEV